MSSLDTIQSGRHETPEVLAHEIIKSMETSGGQWRTAYSIAQETGLLTEEVEAYFRQHNDLFEISDVMVGGTPFYRVKGKRPPIVREADLSVPVTSDADVIARRERASLLLPWKRTLRIANYILAGIVVLCFVEAIVFGFFWFFREVLKISYPAWVYSANGIAILVGIVYSFLRSLYEDAKTSNPLTNSLSKEETNKS